MTDQTIPKALGSSAVLVLLLAATIPVRASADSPLTLTVRLYNTSGIPTPEFVSARRAAESMFRDTGLNVIFRPCGRQSSEEDRIDACSEPLTAAEVVVRIIDAPAFNPALHPEAFGVAYVVPETNRGWLATVFSDRIAGAASRVGVESGTLLGLVIAHEVGHLLLGIGYHGEFGIMRADWPERLLASAAERWHFSSREAAGLRHAAALGY